MIIEIDEHGAKLARDHECFLVIVNGEKKEFPVKTVDGIVISSNASMTTAAVKLCLENGIQLVLTDYARRPLGRFWFPSVGKNAELRRHQYLAQNTRTGLSIAEGIVKIKVREQRKLLLDLKNNRDGATQELKLALQTLDDALAMLERKAVTKGTLLGIEGNCAKEYFRAISSILPTKYRFLNRSQHPPEDAFNCLLNFGYGLAYPQCEKAIVVSGLEPNAGLLHEDQYGKPTLSYDLIELFRPKIDRLVIALISKRKVSEEWFENSSAGFRLSKRGRREMIEAFHRKVYGEIEKQAWPYCREIIKELMAVG